MSPNPEVLRKHLKAFAFKELMVALGWDRITTAPLVVPAGDTCFTLNAVVHKRGMVVYVCDPGADGKIPDITTRRRIDREVGKTSHEHLIVFIDAAKTTQVWQWYRRRQGDKPAAVRSHTFHKHQPGESLIQKLLAMRFTLAEEETLTQPVVPGRVRQALDVDRVTRRFFDLFKAEHKAFLDFIENIPDEGDDRAWYASVMLNRLMFIYFIQKQGFLDGDRDYLRNRLRAVRQKRGTDQFHGFYRYFLLRLFHEGLALPKHKRKADLDALLGKVPYLNGGIFDLHEIEERHTAIHIPDEAFERIFTFFDRYQWHLDDRPLADDHEINPDVLGYIFEKYINQKQMGAYYTKEDITGYIARNTIVPFLLDAAAAKCPDAFRTDGPVWGLPRGDPDRYIFDAVRKGVDVDLPADVAVGLDDVARRNRWNRSADSEFALPTETWREHVARRLRCLDMRATMQRGDLHTVNDLVTHNLDVCLFAEDVINTCDDRALLWTIWQALESVSVLDPTCGSGAFLFAALNVLQPLYDDCLERMEELLQTDAGSAAEDFRRVLDGVRRHPSRDYFILKSIIVNNLFGVDIMREAGEICKLRLFLKLVAQVKKVDELEPLPDIDFNIRAGNTLVGFARLADVKATLKGRITYQEQEQVVGKLIAAARDIDDLFGKFRRLQTEFGPGQLDATAAKNKLRLDLEKLRGQLDRYLARDYNVDPDSAAYETWYDRHQPFHWLAEFYGIMAAGGFDVIIGNPPWREYASVKREYTVLNYASHKCGNLHGICTERALSLRSPNGRMSFIVQLPLTSSSRMAAVRNLLRDRSHSLHVLSFGDRPGKLFDGLENCRSVVFLSEARRTDEPTSLLTTRYHRWPTAARSHLFANVEFAHVTRPPIYPDHFPKSVTDQQEAVFAKVQGMSGQRVGDLVASWPTKHFIFYLEATQYWVKATLGLPHYAKNGVVGAPAHGRYLYFHESTTASAACAVLNSSLFYAYFITHGDCFHLSDTLATGFPVPESLTTDSTLAALGHSLMDDLSTNAEEKTISTKDGNRITYAEFYAAKSKPLLDQIDAALAKHYCFTAEELDFIINYDIKYRLGQDAEDD